MNRLRLIPRNVGEDSHRPASQFWGPVSAHRENGFAALDCFRDANQPHPQRCPICLDKTLRFVANVYGWPVHECERCKGGFVWPQPSSRLLEEFYGPAYWSGYLGSSEPLYCRPRMVQHEYNRYVECIDRIMRRDRKARILDVGAGDGTLLRLLSDVGYGNAVGIDVNEENVRRAREQLGVQVATSDFLTFGEKGWDAITIWAVIEHLRDPLSYLRHAKSLLAPGGRCIVMTGDNSSAHAWVQGTLDYWIYPPEHLFYFNRTSLRWLFRRAEFQEFRCRLQFQPLWKESILWSLRFMRSFKARLNSQDRFWRSNYSNLLVAWGKKPD